MLLVFDLDDTLVDTQGTIVPPLIRWVLKDIEAQGFTFADFDRALVQWLTLNQYAGSAGKGLAEFAQIYHLPHKLYQRALKHLYYHPVFTSNVRPIEGAIELLKALKQRHTLMLVSRGQESVQRQKMALAGIEEAWFGQCHFVTKGSKKQIYSKILLSTKNSAQNALVCGDRIKADLTPAKELGMKTVQIRSGRGLGNTGFKTHVDYTIVYLRQLSNILHKLENEGV